MGRVIEWVFGVAGAVTAFLGLFILYGGDDQYLGYGGSTWRVGDIAASWGYGLLTCGVVLLVAALALAVRDLRQHRVHKRQSEFAGLMTHLVIFLTVNAFLWIEDIASGGGLQYAYWVTIPWGIGLLAQALAYLAGTPRALRHH